MGEKAHATRADRRTPNATPGPLAGGTLRPPEPPDRSRAALAHLEPALGPGMGEPLLLIGAGRGERVRALLGDPRHARSKVCVLVLDEDSFRASVAAGDWEGALSGSRVAVGRGPDSVTAFARACDDDDAAIPDPGRIAIGDPGMGGDRARVEIERLLSHRAARLDALGARLDDWIARKPVRSDLSVFSSADRSTTALRHLGRELMDAAASMGMRATFHETDLSGDPFRPLRRMQAFLDASPTLLVSFVSSRARDFGAIAGGVPSVSYWSSDPERYALDTHRFADEELVCVSDRAWQRSFARRGIESTLVPLATGLHRALPDDGAWDVCANPGEGPVLVVGNLPRAEDVLPASLRHRAQECRELALSAPRDVHRDEADPIRRGIDFERTALDRRDAAVLLAAAGVPVVVHGDARWGEALRGTAAEGAWRGPLATREESAVAFRRAAAVVNVVSRNSTDGVNMRAFDVTACGGLLVSSRRAGLADAFRVGVECADFGCTEELVSAVRSLLADPSRRARMRAAARSRALRDHTWESRWRLMLDALASRRRAAA